MKLLIIDDEAIRVEFITVWVEKALGRKVEVTHSVLFRGDFDEFDVVSLDHDLGVTNVYDGVRQYFPDGYDGDATVIIHSMNPVGATNIRNQLRMGQLVPFTRML